MKPGLIAQITNRASAMRRPSSFPVLAPAVSFAAKAVSRRWNLANGAEPTAAVQYCSVAGLTGLTSDFGAPCFLTEDRFVVLTPGSNPEHQGLFGGQACHRVGARVRFVSGRHCAGSLGLATPGHGALPAIPDRLQTSDAGPRLADLVAAGRASHRSAGRRHLAGATRAIEAGAPAPSLASHRTRCCSGRPRAVNTDLQGKAPSSNCRIIEIIVLIRHRTSLSDTDQKPCRH